MKHSYLLCVLCALCGSGFSAAALNREAFTITKYDLEIRLEPEQHRLGGRGKITLRNDSSQPQKIAALQISSSLFWRAIRSDGKALQYVTQPFVSDIDHTGALSEALVTLPAEIKPKDSVELEIGYEGTIPLNATRLLRVGVPEDIAKHSSWDQISPAFTAVRGAGYVAWYPIATESADFSEGNSLFEVVDRWKAREAASAMNVHLCAPGRSDWRETIVLGGQAQGVSWGSSEGAVPKEFCAEQHSDPLGLIAPAFAVGRYATESKPPLSVLSLPGHDAGATIYFDAFDPATKFVTEWFGLPTGAIAIADLADSRAASFESGTLLFTPMAVADPKLTEINVVHEMVHAALTSRRPWVYEGLAHFAEAMYRQKQSGRQAALDLLGMHRAAFLDSEKDVAATLPKNPGQPLATTSDETYYRSKAAYVWWMLRDMVGDDALKQALHNYRASDDKEQNYVEKLIEAASKKDLAWFFDDWVYHDRGLPDFRVSAAHPWKTERTEMITVTLENLGNTGAEVPFVVRCEGGDVTARLEVRAKSTATMRLELPGPPSEIVVNDGSVPESDLTNNVFKIAPQSESQKSELSHRTWSLSFLREETRFSN